MRKLQRSFFLRSNVILISTHLIGKYLFTQLHPCGCAEQSRSRNAKTGGMIVEVEAYAGPQDRASHAYGNRRTKRTEIMYSKGGVAYVYLCYGIHSLFNIVTNVEDIPHAILVRAIQPTHGISTMLKRRKKKKNDRSIAGGPGALTQALGIDTSHNGAKLSGNQIWLEDRDVVIPPAQIEALPRVGIDYAGKDAKRPWRFRIKNNPWTSNAK
ncbi:DNA-3-methyladenine glycosylase [Verrucomicrobiota bacterium]